MRHAIEVVWTKGDKEWLEEIFRRPAGDISTRPTNSEFIARMAEYISIKLSIADKNGLTVDSIEELRHRLEARGTETAEVIDTRIARAEYEIAQAPLFDTTIVNDDLDKAIAEAHEVFTHYINS